MPDRHPIRNAAIATVLGGLVLAGILRPAGVAGTVWGVVRKAIEAVWRRVTGTVSVPAWLLGLLALGTLALMVLLAVFAWAARGSKPEDLLRALPEPQPDDLQMVLLQHLAAADGASLGLDDFAMRVSSNRLRIGEALERLERDLLVGSDSNVYGTRYSLTRRGRDFLMRKGIV